MRKLLNTEMAGLDFVREIVRFFFLKVTGNTNLKGKINIKKHAILCYFLMVKIPDQNIPLIYLLRQISVGVLCSIVLLRSQSFFISFLSVNQSVERSKRDLAVRFAVHSVIHPAMAQPNQIYK